MATVESLPPDQRAVLQLVLQRGRSYDEIAALLSLDRAAVRERALAALDALGPQTRVAPERRALITDYLLGQLPARVDADTRERLAQSAGERAWARVVASELTPLAGGSLPEIPAGEAAPRSAEGETRPVDAAPPGELPHEPRAAPPPAQKPPSSRRGGAILLGAGALIAAAVVVIIIASSGGSSTKSTSSTASRTLTTGATSGAGTGTTTQVVGQINLLPPSGGKAAGVAEVLKRGAANGIAIVAQGLAPNGKHDAYAVWLLKPPAQAQLLGYVNPPVGSNGRLQTAGGLPANANQFTELLVTLETARNPRQPGKIVLQGALKIA
jgi:hypothetical protein